MQNTKLNIIPTKVVFSRTPSRKEAVKMGVLDMAEGVHGIGTRGRKHKHNYSVTQHIEDNLGRQ